MSGTGRHFVFHSRLHHGRLAHSRGHHTLATSRLRSGVMVLERLLELDSLNVLLVLNFLLHILVSLQQFVVLCLTQLQPLVQVRLQFLFQSVHFILLFLDQLGFGSDDLLRSLLHVLFTLLGLQLLALDLDLVRLLISLL